MKKVFSLVLVICLCVGLVACGGSANNDIPDGKTADLVAWKVGCLDPGAWNAAYGPVYDQLEALQDDLNFEIIYATRAGGSTEDTLAAVQNLIVSGCDALILGNDILYCYMQVADICEEAHVYWTQFWACITEEDAKTLEGYEYYVGSTYEDEVYAGQWLGETVGKLGSKNLCLIGAPAALDFSIRRMKGTDAALAEYGATILAEERDITLTGSAEGGADITNRFIAAYPEIDGIIISGRTHSCLSGVVTALSDAGMTEKVPVVSIDFNINMVEYFENGQISGMIGGHHLGGMYNLILLCNIMNGTPLTESKSSIENHYVEITTAEDAKTYKAHVWDDNAYYGEEILQYIKAYNPDATYDDLLALTESYSLADIVARHG